MEEILDDNAEELDVFLKAIKPINNFTISKVLLAKQTVVNSLQPTNGPSIIEVKSPIIVGNKANEKSVAVQKTIDSIPNIHGNPTNSLNGLEFNSSIRNTIISPSINFNDCQIKTKNRKKQNLESNKIDANIKNFFSVRSKSVTLVNSRTVEKKEIINHKTENTLLSSGNSTKRKKFKMSKDSDEALSPSPKKSRKTYGGPSFVNKKNAKDFANSDEIKNQFFEDLFKNKDEEKFEDNAELLCFLLKQIISEVTVQQKNLRSQHSSAVKFSEEIFSNQEYNILDQFCKLEDFPCKVYVRLLCRSKDWYRQSMVNFKDVNATLDNIFDLLHEKKVIDRDIHKQSLEIQMNLLTKVEVQNLCKLFMFTGKSNSCGKKTDLIDTLIKKSKSQKNVINMFKKNHDSLSLINKLQTEVSKYLGKCFKISAVVKTTFNKLLILFSFPHYFDEEEKRFRSQLYMCMNVHKKFIKFPNYKLSPTLIFETSEDFKIYEEALSCQEEVMVALNLKNYEQFIFAVQKAKKEFNKILVNEQYIERYNRLEPFLKRFSGGHIYAKLLTKYCCKFKTKTTNNEIIEVAQMLLNQNLFLLSKRGKWYEILAQSFEGMKNNKAAAKVLIEALNDSCVDEVQKFVLQLRGQAISKKKNNSIENEQLKKMLSEICTVSVEEPQNVLISGKALDGNNSGFKTVYVESTNAGKIYISVEERALLHYKANDFPKGFHVEGYIVQVLYILLFFDIIYGSSPKGVFQSSYQEAPLDFYSKYFYLNRKDVLEYRLEEMDGWTEEEAEIRLFKAYYENVNTQCLITWKEHFTPELLSEVMKSITLPSLSKVCRRLVLNFRVAKSGFPDLTLWNPEKKKCKFVEVKSPNDKLSPGQKIWLHFLRQNNIDCEVCNIKNISRKLDPSY